MPREVSTVITNKKPTVGGSGAVTAQRFLAIRVENVAVAEGGIHVQLEVVDDVALLAVEGAHADELRLTVRERNATMDWQGGHRQDEPVWRKQITIQSA